MIITHSSDVKHYMGQISTYIYELQPNQEIVSNLLVFTFGLVAVITPVTANILIRISNRYKNEEMTSFLSRLFFKEKIFWILLRSLATFLIALLLMTFLFDEPPKWWIVGSFFWFMINLGILVSYFKKVNRYIFKADEIILEEINKGLDNVLNKTLQEEVSYYLNYRSRLQNLGFSKKKEIDTTGLDKNEISLEKVNKELNDFSNKSDFTNKTLQEKLFYYLDRLSNLGLLKIKEIDTTGINEVIAPLNRYFIEFIDLAKKNSNRFGEFEKNIKHFLNVYERWGLASLEKKRYDILEAITDKLLDICKHISTKKDFFSLFNRALDLHLDFSRELIDGGITDKRYPDRLITNWYVDIVKQKEFKLGYLKSLNDCFMKSIQLFIDKDHFELYQMAVNRLCRTMAFLPDDNLDGILVEISSYIGDNKYSVVIEDRILEIKEKVLRLNNAKRKVTTENFNDWCQRYDELKKELAGFYTDIVGTPIGKKNLRSDAQEEYFKHMVLVRHGILFDRMFAIGSYCLAQSKYNYLSHLLTFRQSPRSSKYDSSILEELSAFSESYFFQNVDKRDDSNKRYYLLALAKIISKRSRFMYVMYEFVGFEECKIEDLKEFKDDLPKYIEISKSFSKEENQDGIKEIFECTNDEDISKIKKIFDQEIPIYFKSAIEGVEDKIDQRLPDKNKIDEFLRGFKEEYNSTNVIRQILQKYHSVSETSKTKEEKSTDTFLIDISEYGEKEVFFDYFFNDRNIRDLVKNCRYYFVEKENSLLLEKILGKTTKKKDSYDTLETLKEDIHDTLKTINNIDDFIMVVGSASFLRMDMKEDFQEIQSKEVKDDTSGFPPVGYYGKSPIPVYELRDKDLRDTRLLLLLNKDKLGHLKEYRIDQEKKELPTIEVGLTFFSQDEESLNEMVENSSEWLKEMLEKKAGREINDLLLKVNIEVTQDMDSLRQVDIKITKEVHYDLSENNFEGYSFELSDYYFPPTISPLDENIFYD